MWCIPSEKRLSKVPTETVAVDALEKVIHLHFFVGGCDWYVAEYNPETEVFFGFVILNGDDQCAEWGYFSFQELKDLKLSMGLEVDCERAKYFKPQKVKDIQRLKFLQER